MLEIRLSDLLNDLLEDEREAAGRLALIEAAKPSPRLAGELALAAARHEAQAGALSDMIVVLDEAPHDGASGSLVAPLGARMPDGLPAADSGEDVLLDACVDGEAQLVALYRELLRRGDLPGPVRGLLQRHADALDAGLERLAAL